MWAAARFAEVMPFERETIKAAAAHLAASGVYIGTSSWKYIGWMGQLYTPGPYEFRGKVAQKRFEKACLEEYAQVFKTVCIDAAYYDFPKPEYLQNLANQVPQDFLFGLKVTDAITINKFPNMPRFGARAGRVNPEFLNADLFDRAFLRPCATIRDKIGVIMFEFSKFHKTDYEQGRDFIAQLDAFLGALPSGWPYAVELRNHTWLTPDYFSCLASHGVTHVFNAWQAMPPLADQMALPGAWTNPSLVAARLLLTPGRKYADAVAAFSPYDRVKEVNLELRLAGAELVKKGKEAGAKKKTLIFINNRAEGNAPETIAAILELSGDMPVGPPQCPSDPVPVLVTKPQLDLPF